jgi:hypothetical protein
MDRTPSAPRDRLGRASDRVFRLVERQARDLGLTDDEVVSVLDEVSSWFTPEPIPYALALVPEGQAS